MTKTKKTLMATAMAMVIFISQTFGVNIVSYADEIPEETTGTVQSADSTETEKNYSNSDEYLGEEQDSNATVEEKETTSGTEEAESSADTSSNDTGSAETTEVGNVTGYTPKSTNVEEGDFSVTTADGTTTSWSKDEMLTKACDVESGTKITLNKDVILGGELTFSKVSKGQYPEKNITFDLGGHTLSVMAKSRIMYLNPGIELTLFNGTISGGTPTGTGFRSNGGAIYTEGARLNANNVTFTDNTAKLGSAIFADRRSSNNTPSYIELNNCIVSNNNALNGNNVTGAIHIFESELRANNLLLKDNVSNGACAGLFLNSNGLDCEIRNSRIEGNNATATHDTKRAAAGITVQDGNLLIEGTVITQNSGMYVGGLRLDSTVSSAKISISLKDSAIYNNSAIEETIEGVRANDIVIMPLTGSMTGIIPTASTMVDGDYDFATKCWIGLKHNDNVDKVVYRGDNIDISKLEKGWRYILTCGEKPEKVAAINADRDDATFYDTLAEAVEAANDGDTIRLIKHDKPGVPDIVNEQITVKDKNITINLNGNKWVSADGMSPVLTIEGTGQVTLKGPSEGLGNIGVIIHNGAGLTLDSHAKIDTIKLGDGKFVTLGEQFVLNDKLNLVLNSDIVGTTGRKLVEAQSDEQARELVNSISVSPVVASTEIVAEGTSIMKKQMNAIFLDGISGNDANDGTTVATAVKTFDKAKELAIDMSNTSNKDVYIFVVNIVTVDGNETWELPNNISLNRYHFERVLINVSGTLTLKNITIDGWADKMEANKPLIRVFAGATLNIEDGAVLKNNYHAPRYYTESGGAIHSKGTVNMSGGTIYGNTSLMGGGIYLTGDTAQFTMMGGTISNNTAKRGASGQTPSGGGIAIDDGATFVLKGGTIEGNESEDDGFGGGISIGVSMWFVGCKPSNFEMTGGDIINNSAGQNGGGIFVQSGTKAVIRAGNISNNECNKNSTLGFSRGIFGGGGIYSNGPRSASGHDIPQADVTIFDAFIADNTTTSGYGAGIAGCATSDTFIRTEGATIYNNHGSDQIFVDPTRAGYGDTAKAYISEFAPGGGINHWKDENGNLMANDEKGSEVNYFDKSKALHLSNDDAVGLDTEGKLAKVFITGNLSHAYGGGIGSNGSVTIKKSSPFAYIPEPEDISIIVNKVWDDQDNSEGKRPDAITFNLLRRKGGGDEWLKVTFITIKPNDDGVWQAVTFEGLPKMYDYTVGEEILQAEYEYTIEEVSVEGYTSVVEGDADNGFTVTNTVIPEEPPKEPETINIVISKIWDDQENADNTRPDSITFTLKRKNSDGEWEQVFQKTMGMIDGVWQTSVTFENLLKYMNTEGDELVEYEYMVEEEKVKGYESKVEGDAKTGFTVTNTFVPNEPEKPTEPEKPEKPEEPEKPTKPEEPIIPNKPEEPVKPENPTEPVEPEEPKKPNKPNKPNKGDNSSDKENPSEQNPGTGIASRMIIPAVVGAVALIALAIFRKRRK